MEPRSLRISVCGKDYHYAQEKKGNSESRYIVIDREWKEGDRVDISFRPQLDVQPLKKFSQYVSVQYGAMVMAQKIANHGLGHDDFVNIDAVAHKTLPFSEVTTLVGSIPSIRKSIRRLDGDSLKLVLKPGAGAVAEICLVPFSRLLFNRYEIYFPRVDTSAERDSLITATTFDYSPSPEQKARYERLQVDGVKVADNMPEREHKMESYFSSTGSDFGQHWRHAVDGGFFMYQMRCLPDKPMSLAILFRQDDSGARISDIQVDGRIIHTIDHCSPMEGVEKPLYYHEVEIPEELTRGKTFITVKFNAHNHQIAGGIFDLKTIVRE
ncbi:MAG: hypothetical protein K6G92_01560 [Bacteroidaceae bacterium]|nr:hypothetical protein [Bacteroidaceae bacterium]